MAEVAQRYQDQLKRIKKEIETSYYYFKDNYERYHQFRKFVFDTSLSEQDRNNLDLLQKPIVEFNVLEAYVSRLRGEFSKQEPAIEVSKDDAVGQIDPTIIAVVEGYIRQIINESNKDNCEYDVYTDQLSGGFSVLKVWTEYCKPMSFDQVIKFNRCYDPTLAGFDPLARLSHKGDGRYCFEMFPKTKDEFEREYPYAQTQSLSFTRSVGEFNWSYKNNKEDIVLLCDFYEKKKKKIKIVKLSSGQVISKDDYDGFVERWNEAGNLAQPPIIVGKPRTTEIDVICRYRIVENQVLEYVETNYSYLPLVFVDGNSVLVKNGINGAVQQMTRPYVYHALGIQRLKNLAGQTLAAEIENMAMTKLMAPKEGIPAEYQEAYKKPQLASIYIYNAFKDDNPDVPLPPPSTIARVATPPEITNTYSMSDQSIQAILGSYDASLGINNNQLSGVAIVEGATQSNAASMPYVVSFMRALNQVAEIIIDLLPKYYKTSRTIPITKKDGKKDYILINPAQGQQGVPFNYSPNDLQVKVDAGVSFTIQKSRALAQIIALMQVSPMFSQFMNQKGLGVLLDNIEIRGVDQLKEMAEQWQQQMEQQQQQQAQQPNPAMMKMQIEQQKVQQQGVHNQVQSHLKAAELTLMKEADANEKLKIIADLKQSMDDNEVQKDKANAEKLSAYTDLITKHREMQHRHSKDLLEFVHKAHVDNNMTQGDNNESDQT